ncbi:uncharacterized protein RJT21DRAFT_130791 [Scheffersomyces amazonensis]|uniref:uncharacterized protein n=1 Tax=Scheffersomyces amazonensis TaxID=1078765 RepID=UPI00315D1B71
MKYSYWITLVVFLLANIGNSAFVEVQSCGVVESGFILAPFLIDAAIDEDNKKLKFLLNSMVMAWNESDITIQVSDVNYTTNRYTTFHVEIDFMGKTFVSENKRFCDLIAVKNNTDYQQGPRFPNNDPWVLQSSSSSTGLTSRPTDRPYIPAMNVTINSRKIKRDQSPIINSFAQSNTTIANIFSNSTGNLIQCPLYNNDSFLLYYEADISDQFHKLGSYLARFSVVSNDGSSQVIGCNKTYITPVQPQTISRGLLLGILILLVVTACINILIIAYSSYQESSNPLLFRASTICNEELLKQLDATVPRIIIYLQFALFIGGLNLQYPGFYQPLLVQIRWCALLGISVINNPGGNFSRVNKADNIYSTMNSSGLKSLTLFSSDESNVANWPNFIITFLIVVICIIFGEQIFIIVRGFILKIVNKLTDAKDHLNSRNLEISALDNPNYMLQMSSFSFRKYMFLSIGQFIEAFMLIFGVPFLVLTTFMFSNANGLRRAGFRIFPSPATLSADAFSQTSSYDQFFLPLPNNITVPPKVLHGLNATAYNQFHSFNSTSTSTAIIHRHQMPIPSIIFGVLLFILWVGLAFFFIFYYLITIKQYQFHRSKKMSKLYTSIKTILLWSFFYNHYKPTKVFYVALDIWSLFSKSLIIGLLQDYGSVQVACLIVLEFIDLILLFTINPYFVKFSWTSTRWMLPVARFFVTVLCIPYLPELGLSEVIRSYVAFVQLFIHCIVAIIFVIQLFYGVIKTILSIIKFHRERVQYKTYSNQLGLVNSIEDFNNEFEYRPVAGMEEKPWSTNPHHSNCNSNLSSYDKEGNETDKTIEEINDEIEEDKFYFRGVNDQDIPRIPSDKVKLKRGFSGLTLSDEQVNLVSNEDQFSFITGSFARQEQFSNLRKQRNDYRVREGDNIYKKYFIDDEIDPEIKALWESRNNWGPTTDKPCSSSSEQQPKHTPELNISHLWRRSKKSQSQPQPVERGFHVSRPKQLSRRSTSNEYDIIVDAIAKYLSKVT